MIVVFGKGIVGQATGLVFNKEVSYIDPAFGLSIDDLKPYKHAVITVPTPAAEQGLDHSGVVSCIDELKQKGFGGIVIIRSTCQTEFLANISDHYHSVVYWPEFLREENYKYEAIHPSIVVLGGSNHMCQSVESLLKEYQHGTRSKWHLTDIVTASIIKLGLNTALAAKLTMFNSLYSIAEKNQANWNVIHDAICEDWRIGFGQSEVPGTDGKVGFGGKCLPKDVAAMANMDVDNVYLQSIMSYNKTLRGK